MASRTLNLAHVVSLRKIGGVERYYSEFINISVPGYPMIHHTIVPRPEIDKEIIPQVLAGSKSIKCPKKFGMIPVPRYPKVLRVYNIQRIVRSIKPDAVVLWNTPTVLNLKHLPSDVTFIYYEHGASWFKRNKRDMREMLDRISGVICNSTAAKRIIELRWGKDYSKKIQICPNALRPGCLPSSQVNLRHKIMPEKVRLGMAGRLVSVKGIPLAIHTLPHLKRAGLRPELLIAGTGVEKESMEKLVRSMGLEDHVRFLGFVSNMSSFYSSIDIFLCPSLHESFGLVCAEAMAHGIPVIATKVDGLPEVVQNNVTGMCIRPTAELSEYPMLGGSVEKLPEFVYDPESDSLVPPLFLQPKKLAEAIITIWTHRNVYMSMRQAAKKLAMLNFDFRTYAQKLVSCICSVVESSEYG